MNGIRHTYEFVKKEFEKENYILLSKEYKNAHTKLEYICPKGHKHSIVWGSWQQGGRCPFCSGKAMPTMEQIRASFEKEGYTLLSKEYLNNKTKLDYICNKGHKNCSSWGSWKRGHRCPYCAGLVRFTLEQVGESFAKEDYILLSKEYINSRTKLNYICSKGHEYSIDWNHWQQGQRCPYCAGLVKLNLDQIKKYFEKENYTLLSTEYKNAFAILEYVCPKGHISSIRWNDWQQGYRCRKCAGIKQSIKQSGIGNHMWKGGISCEPYCPIWSDKEYKNDIKERDDHRCLNPCCSKIDKRLHIHHINYNKKDCAPSNLITLCGSCNSKANKDREWHQAWYKAIMYRRYKYE